MEHSGKFGWVSIKVSSSGRLTIGCSDGYACVFGQLEALGEVAVDAYEIAVDPLVLLASVRSSAEPVIELEYRPRRCKQLVITMERARIKVPIVREVEIGLIHGGSTTGCLSLETRPLKSAITSGWRAARGSTNSQFEGVLIGYSEGRDSIDLMGVDGRRCHLTTIGATSIMELPSSLFIRLEHAKLITGFLSSETTELRKTGDRRLEFTCGAATLSIPVEHRSAPPHQFMSQVLGKPDPEAEDAILEVSALSSALASCLSFTGEKDRGAIKLRASKGGDGITLEMAGSLGEGALMVPLSGGSTSGVGVMYIGAEPASDAISLLRPKLVRIRYRDNEPLTIIGVDQDEVLVLAGMEAS